VNLKKLILLFLLFSFNYIYSQSVTFKKVYTTFNYNPVGNSIICKPFNNDKSFIVSGISTYSITLLKINSMGNVVSYRQFRYLGYYFNFLFNNNKSLTLYSNYDNNTDLLKLDTSFNIISSMQYDSLNWWQAVNTNVISPTFNNGFLLSGGKDTLMPVIVNTDSSGNVRWGKQFISIQGGIQDIVQTQDSGFAIAMNLKNLGASLIKTDSNGNVLWAKSYFRPHGYIHNVLENTDGTMIITGNTDSSLAASPLFFVKLNQLGNVIWAKTFGNSVNNIECIPSYTRHTEDNGYITLATVSKNHGNLLLIKTDSNGNTLWCRAHGSDSSAEWSFSVEQLNDKGYIISGIVNNNIPVWSELYLVRTDSLGHTNSLCEEYSQPLVINNLSVNDSNISVTSVPFTVTTSAANTSTSGFTTSAYDGCVLNNIKELMEEQTTPLAIYPNPCEGQFTVEYKTRVPTKTDIEIYNINSERVYTGSTDENLTSINLTGLAKGLYFVRMSNEKWVKTGKVMVE
jgi:Secretion system C-terminal sorting domain